MRGEDEVGVEDVGTGRVELGIIRPQRRPRVPQQEHLAAGDVSLGKYMNIKFLIESVRSFALELP